MRKQITLILLCLPFWFCSCVTLYNTSKVTDRNTETKFDDYQVTNARANIQVKDSLVTIELTGNEAKKQYEREVRHISAKTARTFSDELMKAEDAMFILWPFLFPALALDIVNPIPILGFEKSEYTKEDNWKVKKRIVSNQKTGIRNAPVQLSASSNKISFADTDLRTNYAGKASTYIKVKSNFIGKEHPSFNEKYFNSISEEFVTITAKCENVDAKTEIGPFKDINGQIEQMAQEIKAQVNKKYLCWSDFTIIDVNTNTPLGNADVKLKLPSEKQVKAKLKQLLTTEISKLVSKESLWLKKELLSRLLPEIGKQISYNTNQQASLNGKFNLVVLKNIYDIVVIDNNSFAKGKLDCTPPHLKNQILFNASSPDLRFTSAETP